MSENNHDKNFNPISSTKFKRYRKKFNDFVKSSAKNFRENTTKTKKVLFIGVAVLSLSIPVGYYTHANALNGT